MRYHLTVFPALGPSAQRPSTIDINPDITALSWSTGPGGFIDLSVELADPMLPILPDLPDPSDVKLFYHVRLRAGEFRVFEGRVMLRKRPGGVLRAFTCQGYGTKDGGMSDHTWYSSDATAHTSGYCLRVILAACAPVSVPNLDLWDDPGVAHTLADFNGMNPQQVLDQLNNEGNGSIPYDFAVWDDQAARLLARIPPLYPDYLIPLDTDVDIEEDASTIWSSVQIDYSIPGSPPTPASFIAGPNYRTEQTYIPRDMLLSAPTQASVPVEAVATAALQAGSAPKTSYTVNVHPERPLRNRFGADVPHHRVRFGQWIQFGDGGPMAMIVKTDHSATTEEATITAGAMPSDYYAALEDSRAVANAVYANVSSVTGAPL